MSGRATARAVVLLTACVVAPSGASGHAGHTQREPWDVCAPLTLGAPCAWQDAQHDLHRGTCRDVAHALMCVRNKPIVRAEAPTPTPTAPAPAAFSWTAAAAGGVAFVGVLGASAFSRRRRRDAEPRTRGL